MFSGRTIYVIALLQLAGDHGYGRGRVSAGQGAVLPPLLGESILTHKLTMPQGRSRTGDI
jgi:hypothetical protein